MVMNEPIEMSEEQISSFESIIGTSEPIIGTSNRPMQPLGNRDLQLDSQS